MCQFWGITTQIGRFEGLGIPFAINLSAYADYCSFYQLSDIDNEKSEIVLSKIDDQTIESGTPVLVRHNTEVNAAHLQTQGFAGAPLYHNMHVVEKVSLKVSVINDTFMISPDVLPKFCQMYCQNSAKCTFLHNYLVHL